MSGPPSDEARYLAAYRQRRYPCPSVTVDLVIFSVRDTDLKVLLIRRRGHPFQGWWALPGGFVQVGDTYDDQGEDLDAAAHRELHEETGLPPGTCYLEQLQAFGAPGRDPRTRVISIAYYALVRGEWMSRVKGDSDALEARWFSVEGEPGALAFDHDTIVRAAVERLRGRIDDGALAFELVSETFTQSELREVYEAVKGRQYDAANFRRRFVRWQEDGLVVAAPGRRAPGEQGGRPAKVYRFVRRGDG
jgi:8-oxo-dGTP diphosphatase